MDHKRSLEHYRDHELVCEIVLGAEGWRYTIRVLMHEGDEDRLLREECSAGHYPTDIEALYDAQCRSRRIVDESLEVVA